MPLDPLSILFALALTAVKAAQRSGAPTSTNPDQSLGMQVLDGLVGGIAANLAHSEAERLRNGLVTWLHGSHPDRNQDIERAVSRSALHADLFCLMEALQEGLDPPRGTVERWRQCAWDRLPESLKGWRERSQGFFADATRDQLRQAKSACEERLKHLEHNFQPSGIDPARLLSSTANGDYGHTLAAASLAALEAQHGGLPQNVHDVFSNRWFGYLCGSFHHELKHNTPVFRIFSLMLQEAGFDRVVLVAREEGAMTRDLVESDGQRTRDHIDRIIAPRAAPFTYTLPALGRHVGRERECATARERWLADRQRPLLIVGPPGIGKSTLALALLHDPEVAQRFGSRRFQLRCDAYATAGAMAAAMGLQWFGLEPNPGIARQVLHKLGETPVAVVIDNFETPHRNDTDAAEQWLQELLGVNNLWLVVGIQGHYQPGGVTWAEPLEPTQLQLAAARDLFCAITNRPAHRSDPHLDPLLRDMDGVPHAVELLAHQATDADCLRELAERWAEEKTALLEREGQPSRATSIHRAYEFAIQNPLLGNDARQLLRLLACLPAGLSEADLPNLFQPASTTPPRRTAAALTRHALAYKEAERFRLLAPLREHVQRTHPAAPDELHRAREHALQLATQGWRVGREGGSRAALSLTVEYANVQWAIEAALKSAERRAIEAARGLSQFSRFTGLGDGNLLLRASRVAREAGDVQGEANCVRSLGDLALARSRHDEARTRFEQALPLYRQVGAVQGEANCVRSLGELALRRSRHDEARALYEQALPLYRQVGDVLGEANCVQSLGELALARSQHDEARTRFEQALPLYRQVGDVQGEANCVKSLGELALARSQHDEARARFEQALPLYRQVGSVQGEANCVQSLGQLAAMEGEQATAQELFESALHMYGQIPEPYSMGWTHYYLALLATEPAERERHREAARAAWTSIGFDHLLPHLETI